MKTKTFASLKAQEIDANLFFRAIIRRKKLSIKTQQRILFASAWGVLIAILFAVGFIFGF